MNEDDVLLQIETDKVTIDVRYTETKPGKIKEYLVGEEDTVTVGQAVCIVDKGNTEGADGEGSIRHLSHFRQEMSWWCLVYLVVNCCTNLCLRHAAESM